MDVVRLPSWKEFDHVSSHLTPLLPAGDEPEHIAVIQGIAELQRESFLFAGRTKAVEVNEGGGDPRDLGSLLRQYLKLYADLVRHTSRL